MKGNASDRISDINHLFPSWKKNTLWNQLKEQEKRFGNQEFVVNETESFTYTQIYQRAISTAKGFLFLGMRPGDHVVILLNNCSEYLVISFALWAIGCVKVPTNPELGRMELEYVITHSNASWIISEKTIDCNLLSTCQQVKKVVIMKRNPLFQSDSTIYFSEILQMAESVTNIKFWKLSDGCQNPDQLSDIMYTSGSTSTPKGVMMTHDMVLRSAYCSCLTRRMEIGRRIYVPLPLFHVYGYIEGAITAMLIGGTVILSQLKFSVKNALYLMRSHQANDIICITNMMERLISEGKPEPNQFPELHAAFFSPSHPKWIWKACRKNFHLTDITTGYGLTETYGALTLTNPDDSYEYVENSHGRIKYEDAAFDPQENFRSAQLSIRDQHDGTPVKDGDIGEIWCRGTGICCGYYHNEQATIAAFTKDGWFKTNDLGRYESGSIHYIGRIGDVYKINGEKVSPQFVMSVIEQCPLVRAVEIVGIKHKKYGHVGAAFIDATETTEAAKMEIKRFCNNHLAKFQVPRHYIFMPVSEWPRTASQKINRKQLQKTAELMLSD